MTIRDVLECLLKVQDFKRFKSKVPCDLWSFPKDVANSIKAKVRDASFVQRKLQEEDFLFNGFGFGILKAILRQNSYKPK